MSLKKLSFISLAFLSINSFAMQEPTEKPVGDTNEQTNEHPSQKQTAKQTFAKSQEVHLLKYYCAKQILINQPEIIEKLNRDKEFAKNIPLELQDYLKFVQKKEELNKYNLTHKLKTHLENCLERLSFVAIKTILETVNFLYDEDPRYYIPFQYYLSSIHEADLCDDYKRNQLICQKFMKYFPNDINRH